MPKHKFLDKAHVAAAAYQKQWRAVQSAESRARHRVYAHAWYVAHREEQLELQREYVSKNKEQVRAYKTKWMREWRHAHPEQANNNKRNWEAAHPEVLIMRSAIANVVKVLGTKTFRTRRYIGCSASELRYHLEAQFKKGMTWANYGEVWEVDHRVPLAWFNLKHCPENLFIASYWTNLQPMFKEVNRQKAARYVA